MSEDSKKLLKKLNKLVNEIEILTKVTALSVPKDKLLEGKSQKEQIGLLDKLGFSPSLIALILGTTSNTVRVALSNLRIKKKRMKQEKKKEVKENGN